MLLSYGELFALGDTFAARRYRRRSSPLNDDCRTMPSFVISEYVISASKRGSTQVVSRFFSGTVSDDVGRAKDSSARRIA